MKKNDGKAAPQEREGRRCPFLHHFVFSNGATCISYLFISFKKKGERQPTPTTNAPHTNFTTPHPTTTSESTRGGRHRARVSMPRMPFVRVLRAVEACVWFARAVLVHGGLRIQRGCQWTPLCGWLCACTLEVLGCCRVAVFMRT